MIFKHNNIVALRYAVYGSSAYIEIALISVDISYCFWKVLTELSYKEKIYFLYVELMLSGVFVIREED